MGSMSDRRSRLLRPCALALATQMFVATLAFPVLAQESDVDERAAKLDTVTVTAGRRIETAQDVPINITAITGTDIQQQGLKDLSDLVQTVPGLFLVDQGGRDTNRLVVRGLNVTSLAGFDGNLDGGGVVAQYLGDIPLYLDLRLLDIDRVEALLGPQGTLYGAGTLGGAIRYIPTRPELDVTSFEIGAGLNGMSRSRDLGTESRFIANLPLGENGAFRASLGYFEDPGFIDYDFVVRQPGVSLPQPNFNDPDEVAANLRQVRDANFVDVFTGRLALRYDFSDAFSVDLNYYHQDQKAGGRTINHVESFGTGRYTSAQRYLEPNDRRTSLFSVELNADLGFATLTSASGYSRYRDDGQRDQTDLLLNFEYGYESFPSFAAFTDEETEQTRYNQEIRLVSNTGTALNWIIGAFHNRSDTYGTSKEFVPGLPEFWDVDRPDALEYFAIADVDFKESAVFGEIGYAFTERWSATVGARHFRFRDSSTVGFDLPFLFTSLGIYGPNDIDPALESVQVSDSDTIFKLNTSYRFNNDVMGYVTLSEGYRVGGSNAIPACPTPIPPGQNVCALPNELLISPDKTLNHEVGLKTVWWDGRLVVNGALYWITWDDIQIGGTTVNGNLPITVNGGQAESRGLELSAIARLTDGLRINASYSYTTAKLTEDAPGIVTGEDAFDGDRLPGSPRQQAYLALNYAQSMGNGLAWSVDYGVSAQSNVFTRVGLRNNGEILGGYATHNAAFTLFGNNWDMRLYARNLLNKYAETGVRATPAFIRDIEGFALRSYYKSVLEPRRVGIDFTYRF